MIYWTKDSIQGILKKLLQDAGRNVSSMSATARDLEKGLAQIKLAAEIRKSADAMGVFKDD